MSSTTACGTEAPAGPRRGGAAEPSPAAALSPLAIDIAVPLAVYFAARNPLGLSTIGAYAASSVVPAVRPVAAAVRTRTLNRMAALILAVNIAGLVLSLVTGDVRLMFAKDSGVSSVIALGILLSVAHDRPIMSDGLRPWVVKGDAARGAAWERLRVTSPRFRRLERRYSLVWGGFLLADCLARLACAWTAPVDMLGWLSTPILLAAIAAAILVSGGAAAEPMVREVGAAVAEVQFVPIPLGP